MQTPTWLRSLPPRAAALPGALVAVALATLAFVAPKPAIDNAPAAWFPQRDARIAAYRDFQSAFGADEVLVVSLQGESLAEVVRRAGALERGLAERPRVARVLSPESAFASECSVLSDPELSQDGLRFVGWAFEGPLNESLRLLEPSASPPRARVIASLHPAGPTARAELAGWLEEQRAGAAAAGVSFRVAGQPMVNLELDRAALEVEATSMPWLVGACVLLLLGATRSPRRTLALLVPVGLSVLGLDGVLGLSGTTSNLIVAIAKPLAFVLLLATGYHLLVAYEDERRAGQEGWPAAWRAARAKAPACALALGTTAVGFGSLASSDVLPIQTFGWLSAVALLVLGVPALLLLLPVLLSLSGAPGSAGSAGPAGSAGSALPSRLGERVAGVAERSAQAWPAVLPLGLALALAGVLGATRLTTQPHAIRYLAEEHSLRRDHAALEAEGVPLAQLELVVSGADAAPIVSDVGLLKRLDGWTRGLTRLAGVRAQVSLPLVLREVGFRTAKVDQFPADSLLGDVMSRRAAEVASYVGEGGRLLRISLAIETLGPEELERLRGEVRASFEEQLGDAGLELVQTGSYDLLLRTQRSLLTTLRDSLLLTALLMQLVLVVVLRSVRLGLAALLPNTLPVALVFVLLGGVGLPVDVGTAMCAAIALGIAVDDTLHFLYAYQRQGLEGAARGTARAILLSSVVIAAGFLAIAPSPFLPTRNFGLLCAAAMGGALVGDLVVLPACLRALGCVGGAGAGGSGAGACR